MRTAFWMRRLVLFATLIGSAALAIPPVAGAAPAAPYNDTNVVGYIGLCNQAGQQVTTGNLTDTPFVWRAVSSQAAPAPYNGSSRTAILVAYLPIQALPPGDWSGAQLTSSSRYTNPQSPMAQATAKDISLQNFIGAFPPRWDGFIQLRMALGASDEPAYVKHYPALNIYVSGNTWTAVGGGQVNCNAGSAESLQTIVQPAAATAAGGSGTHHGSGGGSAAASGAGAKGQNSADGSNGSSSAGSGLDAGGTVAVGQPAGATHDAAAIGGLVVLLILLAVVAFFIFRRLRAPVPAPSGRATGSSPKGS